MNSPQVNSWVDERMSALNSGENWQPNVQVCFARLQKLRSTTNWIGRRTVLLATAAAAAICLSIMAYPSPKVFARRCIAECAVMWQNLSLSARAQTHLTPENARYAAPDFILKDANDKNIGLSEQKGKVVLVNFWATWCHGCQLEIPWFIEFQKKYEKQGLVVIGISMDDDGWKSVRPWLNEKRVNYPIVIGNQPLADRFGLDGMPLTALVDRDGKIADVHLGVVDKDATEKKIQSLLQEKIRR
ncbi:MAG TPA: TlpA disulfide reductase family protein [Candidatus Acidoferrales bacterium]